MFSVNSIIICSTSMIFKTKSVLNNEEIGEQKVFYRKFNDKVTFLSQIICIISCANDISYFQEILI